MLLPNYYQLAIIKFLKEIIQHVDGYTEDIQKYIYDHTQEVTCNGLCVNSLLYRCLAVCGLVMSGLYQNEADLQHLGLSESTAHGTKRTGVVRNSIVK